MWGEDAIRRGTRQRQGVVHELEAVHEQDRGTPWGQQQQGASSPGVMTPPPIPASAAPQGEGGRVVALPAQGGF